MSEYDDLFKKFDEKPPFEPQSPLSQPVPENPEEWRTPKINRWLLLSYVAVTLVASLFSTFYLSLRYPDSDAMLDAITIVEEPRVTLTDSGDPLYPYRVTVSGTLRNGNPVVLPSLWTSVKLYDLNGKLIDTIYLDQENVGPMGSWTIEYSGDYSVEIFSSSPFEYGFDQNDLFYILLNLFPVMICFFLFLFLDRRAFKEDARRFRKTLGRHLGWTFGGFLMVYLAMVAATVILEYLGVSDSSANEQTIVGMFQASPLHLTLLFLLLCIFTPLVEEVVYRKVIFGFMERRWGGTVAILASGALFGLMHVLSYGDFIQSIPYILMGMVFGYVYQKSEKNIFVVFGVHFLNNFRSFALYALMVYGLLSL
ncbi:MAG TPA: CPBP family glutamic-type intramembrane protease [Bacillota bacterium]|nr:CPBP family glutamic-type intramembrane protease [Bacillota bacterium]